MAADPLDRDYFREDRYQYSAEVLWKNPPRQSARRNQRQAARRRGRHAGEHGRRSRVSVTLLKSRHGVAADVLDGVGADLSRKPITIMKDSAPARRRSVHPAIIPEVARIWANRSWSTTGRRRRQHRHAYVARAAPALHPDAGDAGAGHQPHDLRRLQIVPCAISPGQLIAAPERPDRRSRLADPSVQNLIALRRQARRAQLRVVGVGSSLHLAGEFFKLAAGIDVVHVPYKAGSRRRPTW